MSKFQSTKVFDGFSTVFRQWRAEDTHCKYMHGYSVSFKLWFEGDLDQRQWVWDFGGFKRSKGSIDNMQPEAWLSYMFDHTFIAAEDDPHLALFKQMHEQGLVQLRVLKDVGAERFSQFIYEKVNPFVLQETDGRVRVIRVEFREHLRNTAIFEP
ncbi:MAG: 6-carboxytetrahydropterin synthase [Mariprofundaceae bacterium]|nr:6-carboxytetrahydropterin synthase [Mariprofundaceae bacterium]